MAEEAAGGIFVDPVTKERNLLISPYARLERALRAVLRQAHRAVPARARLSARPVRDISRYAFLGEIKLCARIIKSGIYTRKSGIYPTLAR